MRQPGSSFKPYVYATALMNGFKPTTTVVDGPVCIGNWCPHNYGGGYSGAQPLWSALKNSINTVAVKLSIAIGNGNPKVGRAKIVETARKMGIVTPLPDTPSLPIGADEVNVLEHTVAYATFPNLGKAVTPHAILEVRTGAGETIWRFDRDGKKPEQVLPPQVATDMIFMMNKVVEEGTARRAMLTGIKAAGKTGTTNAYRDAWFVGYTGNFVGGVWFGNDDYSAAQPHDRRLAARHDVARNHGICAPGQSSSRTCRACRPTRRRPRRSPRPQGRRCAPRPAMLTYGRPGAGAGRAPDGRGEPRARAQRARCARAADAGSFADASDRHAPARQLTAAVMPLMPMRSLLVVAKACEACRSNPRRIASLRSQ